MKREWIVGVCYWSHSMIVFFSFLNRVSQIKILSFTIQTSQKRSACSFWYLWVISLTKTFMILRKTNKFNKLTQTQIECFEDKKSSEQNLFLSRLLLRFVHTRWYLFLISINWRTHTKIQNEIVENELNWTEFVLDFVEYVHRTRPFASSYFTVFKESNSKTVRLANERFGIYICEWSSENEFGKRVRNDYDAIKCEWLWPGWSSILIRCCFYCGGGGRCCCCCCFSICGRYCCCFRYCCCRYRNRRCCS